RRPHRTRGRRDAAPARGARPGRDDHAPAADREPRRLPLPRREGARRPHPHADRAARRERAARGARADARPRGVAGRATRLSSVAAERLAAQLLAGPPARDPVAVAERLLAVQAQDPRGARLAIRARTTGLTAADVDRALTHDRSLVVTWLNRGT